MKKEAKIKSGRKKYSKVYYYTRELYFSGRAIRDGRIIHTYTFREISLIVAKEYNEKIPESTIRLWATRKDKDFKGSWVNEWKKKLNEGTIAAFNAEGEDEKDDYESPMQKLVKLQKQSVKSDIEILTGTDQLIKLLLREVIEDYQTKKEKDPKTKIDVDIVKLFMGYNVGPKARIASTKLLEEEEDNRASLTGVKIKTAAGRQRVREGLKSILKVIVDRNKKEKILDID